MHMRTWHFQLSIGVCSLVAEWIHFERPRKCGTEEENKGMKPTL